MLRPEAVCEYLVEASQLEHQPPFQGPDTGLRFGRWWHPAVAKRCGLPLGDREGT